MKGNHDATPVNVTVNAVSTSNALKCKSIRFQCADKTTSGQASRGSRHTSYIDNNGGFRQLDSSLILRNRLAGFEQILNVQVDSFPYIRQGFFVAMSPTMAAFESGAIGMPRVSTVFEFVLFNDHFKNVGFHSGSLEWINR
jgi:hypothetical protein